MVVGLLASLSVNTHTLLQSNPAPGAVAEPGGAEVGGDSPVLEQRSQVRGSLSIWQDHFSEVEEGRGQGRISLPAPRRGLREVRAGGRQHCPRRGVSAKADCTWKADTFIMLRVNSPHK